jgi:hypothetical protein
MAARRAPVLDQLDVSTVAAIRRGAPSTAGGSIRTLYDGFASCAQGQGGRELRAITAPSNCESIRFHEHLGFTARAPVANFNSPGRAMVVFHRFHRHLSEELDGTSLP